MISAHTRSPTTLCLLFLILLVATCITALLGGCASERQASGLAYDDSRYVPMSHQYLDTLREVARNPIVIENLKQSNRSNKMTQEQILEADEAWRAAGTEQTKEMKQVLNNEAAEYLDSLHQQHPEFAELFLMDQKGCVTAQNTLTTDYWQGDEDKWAKVFNDKRSNYHVSDIAFDESARLYLHHYSMPIMDQQNRLIGVIAIGIKVR